MMATAQPQNNVAMTTNQQQLAIVPMETGNVKINRLSKRYLNFIKRLSVAEVVLGTACMIIGGVVLNINENANTYLRGYGYSAYYFAVQYQTRSFCEGLWGGFLIVLAGGLGIVAGWRNNNLCLINTHMGFSIVGAVAFYAVLILEVVFTIDADNVPHVSVYTVYNSFYMSWRIILIVLGFLSMILLIFSASFCCCFTARCCTGDLNKAQISTTQFKYLHERLLQF